MFAAVCPECKTMVQYPDSGDGREITCYKCGSVVKYRIVVWELGSTSCPVSAECIKKFRDLLEKAEINRNCSVVYKGALADEVIKKHVM